MSTGFAALRSRPRSALAIACAALALLLAAAVFALGSTMPSGEALAHRHAAERSSFAPGTIDAIDLVAVTDDRAEYTDGCDAISLHDLSTKAPYHLGGTNISPGRLAASSDLSVFLAPWANGGFFACCRTPGTRPEPFISSLMLQEDEPGEPRLVASPLVGQDIAQMGGVAVLPGDEAFLVAGGWSAHATPARYELRKYPLPRRLVTGDRTPLGSPTGVVELDGLAVEILLSEDGTVAHVLTGALSVFSFRTSTLEPLAPVIRIPASAHPRMEIAPELLPSIMDAELSVDGRYLITNQGRGADPAAPPGLTVVDLRDRSAWQLTLAPDVTFTGGLALNRGWKNRGLLAVHMLDEVRVFEFSPQGPLRQIASHSVGPLTITARYRAPTGPWPSVAWSADGSKLIAATNGVPGNRTAGFVVWDLSPEERQLTFSHGITACSAEPGISNDIFTANGRVPSPSPSPSPTLRPSPTPTPTPSATATSTPTPTMVPRPVYLPVALTESCDPSQVRIDVALVIDASSSMREPASPGSSTTKLDAALQAVGSFLDILALDAGDQAAIISFSSDAWLHNGLTADRAALDAALAEVEPGQQTRLDRGIEVGTAALLDDATRDPGNEPVLIVLTDGRANPVPVDVAVERADDAKAEGVTIFTIGLGEDLEVEALRAIASEPAFYLHAPTTGELAGVYAEVARSIPCPASAYWGGR